MEEASDCRKSKQKDQLGALDEIFHGQVGLSSDPPLVGSEKTLKLSLKMKMSWTITLWCSVEGMWARVGLLHSCVSGRCDLETFLPEGRPRYH